MISRSRPAALLAAIAVTAAACSSSAIPIEDVPLLPETNPVEIRATLAGSDVPVVLNVWASWCGPCRSEAPLLRAAAHEWAGEVEFIGIDVRDDQDGARSFIAEFGLDGFRHFFDPSGSVPADLGGVGVPLTFFFLPGGEQAAVHRGVIDERTLALQIDELLRAEG